ncbi:MAG: S-layer homology domain-containing protein [Clostridia bacterium]|nr:S-layer homology domain-containing protein [Clostridia bacterium]
MQKRKGLVCKMKKRKHFTTISMALVGLMLAQNVVMAAPVVQREDITYKSGVVSVPVSTESKEAITYQVYTGNAPAKSTIKGFGEEYLEPDKSKLFLEFELEETGNYNLRISDDTGILVIDNLLYAKKSERMAFVGAVTGALAIGTPTPENLDAAIDTAATALHNLIVTQANEKSATTVGVNVVDYQGYTPQVQKEICIEVVKRAANETLTEDALCDHYQEVESLVRINSSTEADGMKTVERLNLDFEGMKFEDIADAEKQAWLKRNVVKNKTYATMDEIQIGYNRANALYSIDTAKITNVEGLVKGYATLLGIATDNRYTAYVAAANPTINGALVEGFAVTKPETPEELLVALANAVATPPAGGGGGGGAMGGGTIKQDFAITENQNTNQEEPEQVVQATSKFKDVPKTHWAYSAVEEMQREGIISGYGDGTFLPDQTVKREEFVKMIVAAFGFESKTASSYFHDVFDSDWFYPYISAAFEKGIVKGDQLGLFGVNTGITREDATVIASRVLNLAGKSTEATRTYANFGDQGAISDYAREAVKELYCMGRINGTDNGKFEPQRFCTRAEAAMIIYNISR